MAFRHAKHARSPCETWPIEVGLGIFRNSKHARSPAPALFSPLAFRKNGHFARSFTRNCDTTFSPKTLTSYAPPTNLRPSPAAPSPWPLFSYSTDVAVRPIYCGLLGGWLQCGKGLKSKQMLNIENPVTFRDYSRRTHENGNKRTWITSTSTSCWSAIGSARR